MKLTVEEMRFFKREGYLIKRGVMDAALMARARQQIWDRATPSMQRDNPSTWVGPVKEEEVVEDDQLLAKNYRWHNYAMGAQDWVIEMLATNARVFGMAEQLLGKCQVVVPESIRGIYCTLPYADHSIDHNDCHTDGHPFQLGIVGYIDDVEPGGGGFRVWPGSHRPLYHVFDSQYLNQPNAAYAETLKWVGRGESVDCYGAAGDVVFWHQRLGHMAGHNYSGNIRQAALYDFCSKALGDFWRKELIPTPIMLEPPQANMWKDWSLELQALEI